MNIENNSSLDDLDQTMQSLIQDFLVSAAFNRHQVRHVMLLIKMYVETCAMYRNATFSSLCERWCNGQTNIQSLLVCNQHISTATTLFYYPYALEQVHTLILNKHVVLQNYFNKFILKNINARLVRKKGGLSVRIFFQKLAKKFLYFNCV